MILVSALSLLAMSHHPYSTASETKGIMQDIVSYSSLAGMVHGVMILVVMAYTILLLLYSQARNLQKTLVASGFCFFITGSILLIGAAIVSGFISPELAISYMDRPDTQLDNFEALLTLGHVSNQALARSGSVMWLASCLFWSIELFSADKFEGALSILGIFLSVSTGAALVSGYLDLSVSGMTMIVAAIAIWSSGLGSLLIYQSRMQK